MTDTHQPLTSPLCSRYHRAVELIGRRWTGAIVYVLLRGPSRYSDLRAAVPAVTDRMLTERLRELEQAGIVERRVSADAPARATYALTERGAALAGPLEALASWAHDWLPEAEEGATAIVTRVETARPGRDGFRGRG